MQLGSMSSNVEYNIQFWTLFFRNEIGIEDQWIKSYMDKLRELGNYLLRFLLKNNSYKISGFKKDKTWKISAEPYFSFVLCNITLKFAF